MSLENFKNRKIEWDTVNKNFEQSVQIISGDVNARTVNIVITDNGEPIDLTGYSVKLIYKYIYNDISGFVMLTPIDAKKGEFSLTIPTEMTVPGSIKSNLILLNESLEQVIVSKNLKFISDDSTVTDLAQEVNNKIDDFTKLLLENMPQVMRSELNGLHAQTESNTSNIELKANSSDMTSLQNAMNSLQNKVEAFGITPENLVTIKSLLDAIASNASDSEVAELINSVNILTSNISLMSNGDYSPKANQTDLESLQSAVNNQSATVSTKANQTDLDNLQTDVTSQGVAISTNNSRLLSVESGLAEKAEQSALLVEKARIDSFTALTSGSTTGDAELIDGRVAEDGLIYTNIGGAIRSQVSDLKNDLSQVLSDVLVSNVNYLTRAIYTSDYYYITSTEQKYNANGDIGVYSGIAVKANKTYYYKNLYDYYSWIVYNDGTVVRLESTYTTGVKSGSFTTLAKDGYVYLTKLKKATQPIFTDSEEMYNNSVYDSYFVPTEKVVTEDRERIDAIQLGLNTKLDAEHGKNLFNPNENNRLNDFYVKYYDGQIAINAEFSVVVIPVSEGDILSFNLGNLHVCALSRIPNLPTSESPVGGFISGFADASPKQGYVVPTGAVCITVSYRKTSASTLQIERNTNSTVYERYTTGLNATNIIGLKSNDGLIKVGVGYDYATITEAVAAVPDGSTIMLMPGTYIEAVDIDSTNKFLKIIGFSRDACIWQYDVSDYTNPPLEIGKGIIENITFKCTGTGGEALMAYNVHIDTNTSKNSSLQFINCRFINPIRECVGIGLRQNFRLSFINCEFETDSKSCVYCHEEQNNNISGQYIELIDCSMKRNSDGSVILIQETPSLVNNHATMRMQRCIAKNTGMSAVIKATQYNQVPINLEGDGFLGTNLWTLDTVSSLNNDSLLNA